MLLLLVDVEQDIKHLNILSYSEKLMRLIYYLEWSFWDLVVVIVIVCNRSE